MVLGCVIPVALYNLPFSVTENGPQTLSVWGIYFHSSMHILTHLQVSVVQSWLLFISPFQTHM